MILKLLLFHLLFLLLSVSSAQKLSKEENSKRKITCGQGLKLKSGYGRKVLNGLRTKIEDAPWNVAIEIETKDVGLCTGTLISTRHVITARHCFAHLMDYGYVSIGKNQLIHGCENDNDEDLVLHGNLTNSFRIYTGTGCGYRKYCKGMNSTSVGIKKIILPKVCDDKQLDFDDFAIVELSESLKMSRKDRFICVNHEDSNLFNENNRMQLFGFGIDPSAGNQSAGPLRSETVKAEKCFTTTGKAFCTKSISKNQLACTGDSGGGVVQLINDRVTVVGVIYEGVTCEASTTDEQDYVANVAYYSDDICRYAGICDKYPDSKAIEKARSHSSINIYIISNLLLLAQML
ncbi:Peptidase S1 domain-containing protein [Caenorhabditis elegans]|uniref:Peptidase S1 domain-containing protein n=1 Tax=Caenorhabditis elegans TaxID=6239 RepID=P91484_CAEEL|nr:Peptidase S1 domain-containing protein [Caenorhabditis elegans]CCD64269.1 Peptidase S1 domain-containing protein [Caenorhabditis elegans]|eukprot:NP_491364.2 Uncharacterized protein CELE_T21E12.3 [Caenorhabditis elegans]